MQDRELIHFAGVWAESEVRLVRDAVHQFELDHFHHTGSDGIDLPWLCSSYKLSDRMRHEHVFVASRENGLFISAHSPEELVIKIQSLISDGIKDIPVRAA